MSEDINALKNIHFHHKQKGCIIKTIIMACRYKSRGRPVMKKNDWCETHDVLLTRPGWAVGYYDGTASMLLSNSLRTRGEIQYELRKKRYE